MTGAGIRSQPEVSRGRRAALIDLVSSMAVRGASAPLALAANVLLARILGPASLGIYMTLLSTGLIAGRISAYGVGPVLTREIAACQPDQRGPAISSMARWALKLTGSLSLVGVVLAMLWLTYGPASPPNSLAERLAAVAIIPACAWSTIPSGLLSGLSKVASGLAVGNLWKNAILLAGLLAFFLAGRVDIASVLVLQAGSFACAAVIGVASIQRLVPRVSRSLRLRAARPAPARTTAWRRSAGHFLSLSLAWLVLGRLDVILVNALADARQAGLFGVAARVGQVASIAGLVWAAWLQPRVSRAVQDRQASELRSILGIGYVGAVSTTSLLVTGGWLLAPKLMSLMGSSFVAGAVWPFRWLILGYLVWGLSIPLYAFMSMTNGEAQLSRILWTQAGLTLAISVPLIHAWGALGGAWAWSGGLAVGSLGIIVTGYKRMSRLSLTPSQRNA